MALYKAQNLQIPPKCNVTEGNTEYDKVEKIYKQEIKL